MTAVVSGEVDMNRIAGTPQEFVKYLRDDIAKWSKVIKTAGIRVQ